VTHAPHPPPPLPAQPRSLPWPTRSWPSAGLPREADATALEAHAARGFRPDAQATLGETFALAMVRGGRLVFERYSAGNDAQTTFPSWSMAKSMLHAVCGILAREGRLRTEEVAEVPEWKQAGDPRAAITIDSLLRMESGLHFNEDYVDETGSDCIQMLFGGGQDDVAGFAERFPLDHPVGGFFNYSSGTSNIVSALTARRLGLRGGAYLDFIRRELFDVLGMTSAKPRFDAAGTWIASSFVFATARDFARFGLLYLRDGIWEGRRILPEGWVDYARTPTSASLGAYGAHFWTAQDGSGIFSANGFRGQYTLVVPRRDLVVVRLGNSAPEQKREVYLWLRDLVESFPEIEEAA